MWDYAPNKPIIRKFQVEDTDQYRLILNNMPHLKLWKHFDYYKQLCGRIIESCSALMRDIRACSEKETTLQTVSTGQLGLEQYFAWTIYADAPNIFTEDWRGQTYSCEVGRDNFYQLQWGDYTLAIINLDERDRVEAVHQHLRDKYRECATVKCILELQAELRQEESILHKQFDAIIKHSA